jgi:DNA-binding IclR family transcriptional regulator
MEPSEISLHLVKIYRCLSQSKAWMTNKQIAETTGVSLRRTSHHTKTLVGLGILDQAELYPGHRYRMSDKADKRNGSYLARLKQAENIFQTEL